MNTAPPAAPPAAPLTDDQLVELAKQLADTPMLHGVSAAQTLQALMLAAALMMRKHPEALFLEVARESYRAALRLTEHERSKAQA